MKKMFIYLFSLLCYTSIVYPSNAITFDPSEPPRYEINGIIRKMEDIVIDVYYKDKSAIEYTFINTVSYKNGVFNPTAISIDTQNLNTTLFCSVYRLSNGNTEVQGYSSKIPQEQIKLPVNVGRVVNLNLSSSKQMLMFPVIKDQGSFTNLHFAMNAHYVMTHYLPYAKTKLVPSDSDKGYNQLLNKAMPVKLLVSDADKDKRCFYSSGTQTINMTRAYNCGYYDHVYKHEYGHHLTRSVFKIPTPDYEPTYELVTLSSEDTAIEEGFSAFLSTREPFSPYLADDFYKYMNLSSSSPDAILQALGSAMRDKYRYLSGESMIASIAIAMMALNTPSIINDTKTVIEKYKSLSSGVVSFKTIWDSLSKSERKGKTNVIGYDGYALDYNELLEEIGIVYCRGILDQFTSLTKYVLNDPWKIKEKNANGNVFFFQWYEIKIKYKKIGLPLFPNEFQISARKAEKEDLLSLKKQAGKMKDKQVRSTMANASDYIFEILSITKEFGKNSKIEKAFKKMNYQSIFTGSGTDDVNYALDDLCRSKSYNNWKAINGSKIKINDSGVYAIRVRSKSEETDALDTLNPVILNTAGGGIHHDMSPWIKNLIRTGSLFIFEIPDKQVFNPKLNPTARPSNLPNNSNKNRIQGSSAVNPNYTKDGSEAVTAEVTVALPGVVEVKDAKGIIETELIFRDNFEGKYKNLTPEIEKGEEEGQFIVKSEFNPRGNGEHKITAQFGELKEDEIEDAKANNTYAELIYTNDLVIPSVDDKFKKTTDNSATIYGSITENESGVGILSITAKDKDGEYIGANIDYDIQLAGNPEITFSTPFLSKYMEIPAPYRKQCWNFIPSTFYDPLTGKFQLGTFEAYAPMTAKIKYKVTDKAGNESIQSVSLDFMNIPFDASNKTDVHEKYNLCSGSTDCLSWEILPEVLSPKNNDYLISPATCSKQDIVLLNNKPEVEGPSFTKIDNTNTITQLGDNKITFSYKDPDGPGDLGIDTARCSVSCSLTGELPREFSEAGGTYTHTFTIDDDLLQGLEGEFTVDIKIKDKLGAEGTKSEKFHLNMGAPEIDSDDELRELSAETEEVTGKNGNVSTVLQGLISDRGTGYILFVHRLTGINRCCKSV